MEIWNQYRWKFWDPENEPLPENPENHRRISICTTCMGRTHDLKETLPVNMKDNEDYQNLEFVLVNYASRDDMDEWVKSSFEKEMESGRLRYVKVVDDIQYFEMGHSRNIAFKAATGEIVNNVDADNYTNREFASTLNKMAELQPRNAVFAKGKRLMHGRLGFYKDEFIRIGGYDEDLSGYGFDDHNLLYRAMASGMKMMWWGQVCKMRRIKTPRALAGQNMADSNWKRTQEINRKLTFEKLARGEYIANRERNWGSASVIINFTQEIAL